MHPCEQASDVSVATLKRIQDLRAALMQPRQSCDASSHVDQLQNDVVAQQAVIRALEHAVEELRQAQHLAVRARPSSSPCSAGLLPAAASIAEAVARSPPNVPDPAPADRLPTPKSTHPAQAVHLQCVERGALRVLGILPSSLKLLSLRLRVLHGWLSGSTRVLFCYLWPMRLMTQTRGKVWVSLWPLLSRQFRCDCGTIKSPTLRSSGLSCACLHVVGVLGFKGFMICVRLHDLRKAGDWDSLHACVERATQVPCWWCPPWSSSSPNLLSCRSRQPLQCVAALLQTCAQCHASEGGDA